MIYWFSSLITWYCMILNTFNLDESGKARFDNDTHSKDLDQMLNRQN